LHVRPDRRQGKLVSEEISAIEEKNIYRARYTEEAGEAVLAG